NPKLARVRANFGLDSGWQLAGTWTVVPVYSDDQRRTGVRATGSYWGAAGEQIDLNSGNLNFTIPLISAQARGGWAGKFALSYNSQIWKQSSGTVSNLGMDVGYGRGWMLMAGSIVHATDHLIFR